MKVAELKNILGEYDDNAEVIVINWSNGNTFVPTIGSDDDDEGTDYCRIGI